MVDPSTHRQQWQLTVGKKAVPDWPDPKVLYDLVNQKKVLVCAIGFEIGKKTEYHHLQCAVKFSEPVSFDYVSGLQFPLQGEILTPRNVKFISVNERKKWHNAVSYCRKGDRDGSNKVYYYCDDREVLSVESDKAAVIKEIQNGTSVAELWERYPFFLFSQWKFVKRYIKVQGILQRGDDLRYKSKLLMELD